jgi:flagellar basal body-associated protein FliL
MDSVQTSLILLLVVFVTSILTMAAVGLGGLLVFRTKKESHEKLFSVGPPKGESFVVDDFSDGFLDQQKEVPRYPKKPVVEDALPEIIARQNADFLNQLKQGKKEETGEKSNL